MDFHGEFESKISKGVVDQYDDIGVHLNRAYMDSSRGLVGRIDVALFTLGFDRTTIILWVYNDESMPMHKLILGRRASTWVCCKLAKNYYPAVEAQRRELDETHAQLTCPLGRLRDHSPIRLMDILHIIQ